MKKKLNVFYKLISSSLLLCLIGCNANISEVTKSAKTDNSIRKSVSKSIQTQMDILETYQDEDIIALLESESASADEIVSKALAEDGGADYVDFCYATNQSITLGDSSYIMNKAKSLMNESDYNRLKQEIDNNEKSLKDWGEYTAKELSAKDQEAFYKDLKSMIVKSSIMLVSAIVYVAVPPTVMWGKIPAATALSIAAGVCANSVMDIVGFFNYGYIPEMFEENNSNNVSAGGGKLTFQMWLDKLKESPVATHAITTAVTSYCTTLGFGKVPTAIVLCMFTAYNALDAIIDMKRTYGF